MASIPKQIKARQVQSMPGTPEANTIYFVEVDANNMDVKVTDDSGQVRDVSRGPVGPTGDAYTALARQMLGYGTGIAFSGRDQVFGIFDYSTPANDSSGKIEDVPEFNFARSTAKYTMGPNGKYQVVAAGEIAYWHDPLTGVRKGYHQGLGITQMNGQPFDFGSTLYTHTNITDNGTNSDCAIDGGQSRELVGDGTNSAHQITRTMGTSTNGNVYTAVTILKPVGVQDVFQLRMPSAVFGGTTESVTFTKSTETLVNSSGIDKSGFIKLLDGHYLFWAQDTAEAADSLLMTLRLDTGNATIPNTDGMLISYFGLHEGYMFNRPVAASATEVADDLFFDSIPGTLFPDGFSAVVKVSGLYETGQVRRIMSLGNEVVADSLRAQLDAATERMTFWLGSSVGELQSDQVEGQELFVALAVDNDQVGITGRNARAYHKSTVVDEDTMSGYTTPTDFTTLHIGNYSSGLAQTMDGVVEWIVLVPVTLPESEIQRVIDRMEGSLTPDNTVLQNRTCYSEPISVDETGKTPITWQTGQSYTTLNTTFKFPSGNRYDCILNHTSAADNEPESGANWQTYWRLIAEPQVEYFEFLDVNNHYYYITDSATPPNVSLQNSANAQAAVTAAATATAAAGAASTSETNAAQSAADATATKTWADFYDIWINKTPGRHFLLELGYEIYFDPVQDEWVKPNRGQSDDGDVVIFGEGYLPDYAWNTEETDIIFVDKNTATPGDSKVLIRSSTRANNWAGTADEAVAEKGFTIDDGDIVMDLTQMDGAGLTSFAYFAHHAQPSATTAHIVTVHGGSADDNSYIRSRGTAADDAQFYLEADNIIHNSETSSNDWPGDSKSFFSCANSIRRWTVNGSQIDFDNTAITLPTNRFDEAVERRRWDLATVSNRNTNDVYAFAVIPSAVPQADAEARTA